MAEGQPRNILDHHPTRFASGCRVPSWRCHHVIHSCYAFLMRFVAETRATPPFECVRVMLNDVRTPAFHQIKTTVRIGRLRSETLKQRGRTLFSWTMVIVVGDGAGA